ncbi:hypothetical protein C4D60_Mb06t30610 [Musa balbisiana]|uniref:GB1/RHD3-type G domain-containing protein n=1 Tax=Musa balbisiana TaxID=52838 RepID=A0A4S8ISM6_MUSBA|nr:hypothetical protein C4D60_Mb06t30610 [Musa balbisiana]
MGEEYRSVQLIDGDGEFNFPGVEHFMKATRLAECGLSYAVVSIMGPQSSGKSTLLNRLFQTDFREMDALRGRSQTTKGIWLAKCVGIDPCTVVMDLEGTDGRERGEDDTAFEKQSALFALAISDIVLINMWCHDIGREQAANKPLLKTVFQVMMRLFSPRKTTLLFVIRDKTKTPLEHLEPVLREDIQKIWDSVSRPDAQKDTTLSEFFNLEVTALSSYEEKEIQFENQLGVNKFSANTTGGLAGDRRGVVPASGFSFSAQQIWKVIRENKDLDLPAHKVMVATVRCEEIANEKLSHLTSDERWLELEEAVQSGPVSGFGKKLGSILDAYMSECIKEGSSMTMKAPSEFKLVHPTYQALLGHLRTKFLEKFKNDMEDALKSRKGFASSVRECSQTSILEFDQGCADAAISQADWDTSRVREKLSRDIDAHAHSDTWASIRNLYKHEAENALSEFSSSLSGFELDKVAFDEKIMNLKEFARSVVEKKAREEAGKVLIRMKDRFSTVFSQDKDSMPRVWTGKEDVRKITKNARAEALKLLSVMAAIRLDENPDKIESTLLSTLMDAPIPQEMKPVTSTDPLASSTWEEVSPSNTLITPVQCKSLWRQFKTETEYSVTQAISAQEAHKRGNSVLPPPWAILAIAILGFNELMVLLRNPLYLLVIFVVFLLFKALWVQLDVSSLFQNGLISGFLSLSTRFLPTVMDILRRLADEGQGQPHVPQNPQHPPLDPLSFRRDSQRQAQLSNPPVPDASSSSSTLSSPRSGVECPATSHMVKEQ